jgi:hypothetical protein
VSDTCNFQVAKTESIRQSADSGLSASDTIYYSFDTCGAGSADTFARFQRAALLSAAQIADEVRAYVEDLRDYVEQQYIVASTADASGTLQTCSPTLACQCSGCSPATGGWCSSNGNTCYSMDPTVMTVSHTVADKQTFSDFENQAHCMALQVQNEYRRIARREWNDPMRMGNIYFGDQRSGVYLNYPGLGRSMCGFQPRFRPWYAAAVSGPKDVIIVIDRSGSMSSRGGASQTRWELAKAAVFQVLDTLTEYDFVGVVTFNTFAEKYDTTMVPATVNTIEQIRTWLDLSNPAGSTNFEDAFTKAFQIASASHTSSSTSSQCNGVVLFLTDGVDTSEMDVARVAQLNGEFNYAVFTYALGSGADGTKPKAIACANNGIFYQVADGGNIGDAMSDYFRYYASALAPHKQVRWRSYADSTTTNTLITGCLSVYNRTGGASTLLGVQCMDVSLIISTSDFQAKPDYQTAWDSMQADSQRCYQANPTASELENLRFLVGGCQAQCDVETCNVASSATSVAVPSRVLLWTILWSVMALFALLNEDGAAA